ncbi:adenosine deaminase [Endozoicomonas sp. G2_1]|uniref:adenosine deaminase n=1 Tax=Endozoicomonas sp. G2_1 TaxID=2821091 RepID=UPI001ADB26E1|nr:adenosine deaminase [Endozoicomonas sp. G2_1]MBO9490504.1 adenosine deaminase [Endozoicomonas sp. G2_1]
MPSSQLPLVDLHRHLDGNIRPNTIWQLANQHGIELPAKTFEALIPYVQIQNSEPDLVSFLKKLDWGVAVLKTLDDCKRIAYENVEDAHNAGLDYAELRFSPFYMAMKHKLNVTDVVAAVIDGVAQGCREFDTKINLIGILSRSFGVDNCQLELDALLHHKDKLVAMDLAGDEKGFAGELFLSHFNQVKAADLQVTVHAGEACGPESVWQAIRDLGATRIGHGVACAQDPKLLDYMVKNNIIIESCLTSNFQTGTVTDLSKHPLKLFLQHGVVACLNTDDPAVEGIEIKHEYQVAREQLGLNQAQLDQLQLNGVTASFLSDSEKQQLKQKALT